VEPFILIAITAYLLFAINGVIDKFLLNKGIPEPVAFAFYVGIGSSLVVLLFPFGFEIPAFKIILIALASGLAFFFALIALYTSLKYASASRVLPTVGALVPVATYPLSWVLVNERLSAIELCGMLLLVAGSLLLTRGARSYSRRHHWSAYTLLAAGLFAISFTLSKIVYIDQVFVSGLIWTRFGLVLGALMVLLFPHYRRHITATTRGVGQSIGILFIIGQAVGATAGILQNYAISLGSVTIVNALQGTQFAILVVLTWVLSTKFPKILREDFSAATFVLKSTAIIVIILGLGLIAF